MSQIMCQKPKSGTEKENENENLNDNDNERRWTITSLKGEGTVAGGMWGRMT